MKWPAFILLVLPLTASADASTSDVLAYSSTMCFGTCPIYKAMLFSDGMFIFDGQGYVAHKGIVKVARNKALFKRAVELIEKYQFRTFKDRYTGGDVCPQNRTDAPSTIITFQHAGMTKTVIHYHGCKGFNRESKLNELEKKLRDLLGVNMYIKGNDQDGST